MQVEHVTERHGATSRASHIISRFVPGHSIRHRTRARPSQALSTVQCGSQDASSDCTFPSFALSVTSELVQLASRWPRLHPTHELETHSQKDASVGNNAKAVSDMNSRKETLAVVAQLPHTRCLLLVSSSLVPACASEFLCIAGCPLRWLMQFAVVVVVAIWRVSVCGVADQHLPQIILPSLGH